MRLLRTALTSALLVPVCFPHAALAQTAKVGDATFFIAQKLWLANWGTPVVNTVLVPPSAANPAPLIQTSNTRIDVDDTIPLTSIGVRVDRWSLSATVSPSTRFGDGRIAGGSLSRSEYDVNLGYALTPNVTAALVYKGGKNTIRGLAGSAAPEIFANAEQKLSGWGAGMNLTAPVSDNFGAYGTVAYAFKGRATVNIDQERLHPKYKIIEAGLAYRVPAGFAGLSVQAGYRYQDVRFKDVPLTTFALTPAPVVAGRSKETLSAITKGFVVGVSVSF